MVAEKQDMAGNNMDFHKSRDETTRLVSNDNTGVLESKQRAQDIRKEDLKRAAMQERKRREKNAQVLRCSSEELKVLALKERRNRESIAEVIKHQSTPEVDSEVSNREELKRRALEERRMRERDRRNLAGVPLMRGRHPQHRGNERNANVGEARAKDNCASNSDSKGATLQHNKIHDHNRRWREKQQQKPAQGENKQQLNRAVAWNKKVGGGIKICARPPSLTDARDASPAADDDVASEKAATLDDVTSPDIGVGGEHIDTDTDERAAPMRELPEKLVENTKELKTEKTAGISKSHEEALLIAKAALKKLASESRDNEQTKNVAEVSKNAAPLHDLTPSNIGMGGEKMGTNRAAASMRVLSKRLVENYEVVATDKEAEKLSLNELQEWPENLRRRLAETEEALNAERVAHAETRQKLKELIVAKEDGVSPKDVSRSPVIEVGGERDANNNSSAAASMTEFREVKLTADDLRVELEVKNQLDEDVSRSPVIEVGGERDASINSSAAASMTEFREVKSTADDLRDTSINSSTAASMTEFREVKATDVKVGLEVKSQLDKDRTHTNSEVGGGQKQLKNKWAVEFKEDETIKIIEVWSLW